MVSMRTYRATSH